LPHMFRAIRRTGYRGGRITPSRKGASMGLDLVIVSNRLPVDRVVAPDGTATWRPSPGGLVAALEPTMQAAGGAWVGWSGAPDLELEPFELRGMRLVPVALSAEEVAGY